MLRRFRVRGEGAGAATRVRVREDDSKRQGVHVFLCASFQRSAPAPRARNSLVTGVDRGLPFAGGMLRHGSPGVNHEAGPAETSGYTHVENTDEDEDVPRARELQTIFWTTTSTFPPPLG